MARFAPHLLRALPVALLVALLAACAGPAAPLGDGEGTRGTGSPGPSFPPVEDSGDAGDVTPGEVTVRLAPDAVQIGEALVAIVANGLEGSISTLDSKADCSILHLDRLDGGWIPVPGCLARRPPLEMEIGPSLTSTVTIDTASDAFAAVSPPGLEAGTYRLRLTYRIGPSAEEGEPLTAISAEFEIG